MRGSTAKGPDTLRMGDGQSACGAQLPMAANQEEVFDGLAYNLDWANFKLDVRYQ